MRKFIIFIGILVISTIACSIQKIEPENSVPPLSTNTPNPTATCTISVPPLLIGTVNVDKGLNLREEPNEHSAVIMTLLPNSQVEILSEEENGWLCVEVEQIQDDLTTKKVIGYVNGDFIQR